ncbi:MAG: class II histone deacetylase [Caldilineaceae bacterium]
MTTGFIWSEWFAWHETGSGAGAERISRYAEPYPHVESPDTKRRIRGLIETSGLLAHLAPIAPRPATEDELARFHALEYIRRIQQMSAGDGGDAGDGTPFGHGAYEIACLAAGGTMAAIDAVLSGQVDNAYALVRPPGHHAEATTGRGFCLFGNIVVALKHAQAVHGLQRAAVIDWDVHHGNGTQAGFYADPSVLTISLHQDGLYPYDSGFVAEIGEGMGAGSNMNIPLPAGSGHAAYLTAFERVVLPALAEYRPQLIVVASGFDASAMDPLGQMMCHSETYRALTQMVMTAADELCGGKLVMSHEGGYSPIYVPFCGLAVLEAMSGVRTPVEDPYLAGIMFRPGQELQSHQAEAIERAVRKG